MEITHTLSSLPDIVVSPPGPRSKALADRLRHAECPAVTYLDDEFPIFWDEAQGCMVKDVDGNILLDCSAAFGVAAVGHNHPEVVKAVQSQAQRLLHGMGDVHPTELRVKLGERLTALCPGDLGQPLFTLPGAEAVEVARKTCMMATGKPNLLAFTGGYHGLTYGALEVTSREDFRKPFKAQLSGTVQFAPYPYCYRCPVGKQYPDCALECINVVERMLDEPASGLSDVGGVLIEPIQGRGGTITPPPEYLPALRRTCDQRGLLLIADEIFTGFGRTGEWFACDHSGTVPDLMTVGKAMSGGLPISACVGRPRVMGAWPRSKGEALHTSTFMGNPLSCAAALAALRVLEDSDLIHSAQITGQSLLERLRLLQKKHPCIGDVRGQGLMIGFELVKDRSTREPAGDLCIALMKDVLGKGLIILPEGPFGNIVGLTPPLNIMERQLDFAIEVIDQSLLDLTGA